MEKQKHIRIGTSGWYYRHWLGPFYPKNLAKKDFLSFYSQKFLTAEINNTFYKVPQKQTLLNWKNEVPAHFIFSAKASQYITHMKKLKDPQEPVARFFSQIEALGEKLGPILFQLPPHWKINPSRLDFFLKSLPSQYKYVFEFRDPSWFHEDTYSILKEQGAAFCIYDFNRRLSPKEVTAEFIYIRLHGPDRPYQGQYDKKNLSGWAESISEWKKQGKDVFCYFDNDQLGYAAQDALHLKQILDKE